MTRPSAGLTDTARARGGGGRLLSPRHATRLAWFLCGSSFVLVALYVGLVVWAGRPLLGATPLWTAAFLGFPVAGVLIATRRPANPIGWILLAAPIAEFLTALAGTYAKVVLLHRPGSLPGGEVAAWAATWTWLLSFAPAGIFLPLLFPTGRLLSSRWRLPAWVGVAGMVMGLAVGTVGLWPRRGPALLPLGGDLDPIPDFDNLVLDTFATLIFPVITIAALSGLASLVVRYFRSGGEERLQLKWLGYAFGLSYVLWLLGYFDVLPNFAVRLVSPLGVASIAAATGIAILKYRLYDIDVVISKTVVFACLAGFITAVYVAIVVGVGGLIGAGGEPNLGLSVAATAVVAVAFGPVRERVQRVANRLVYGVRATPYEVLSAFSARLGDTAEPDELLARMARLLAQGTGAAVARVWLRVGDTLRPAAAWADDDDQPQPVSLPDGRSLPVLPDADATTPVVHHGDLLGALTVAKARGDTLTPTDSALISDLAAQAGLVLRNVRLTAELMDRLEELRASRQRLVAAQDTERRRLERDLHDGAQQQLVALKIKLGLVRTMAEREQAGKTAEVVGQLAGDADDAIFTLRDLARGIYPPLLADQGLAAALQAQARKAPLPWAVHADDLGRFSQDTEAAVYFCCLEALQNTAKYAAASHATISLEEHDGQLVFTVADDGAGFDPATTTRGSGLTNMADRLDAHGGSLTIDSAPGAGTKITGRLPARMPQPTA